MNNIRTPKEMAGIYLECLEGVRTQIPADILGKDIGNFSPEDYRVMTSSVMIAYFKQFEKKGGGGQSRKPPGPCSDKQIGYLENLVKTVGKKKAEPIIEQFLESNGLKEITECTSGQASALIDTLKAEL